MKCLTKIVLSSWLPKFLLSRDGSFHQQLYSLLANMVVVLCDYSQCLLLVLSVTLDSFPATSWPSLGSQISNSYQKFFSTSSQGVSTGSSETTSNGNYLQHDSLKTHIWRSCFKLLHTCVETALYRSPAVPLLIELLEIFCILKILDM